MFKDINPGKKDLSFKKVSPELEKLPSWLAPEHIENVANDMSSLRPPRMPTGIGPPGADYSEPGAELPANDWTSAGTPARKPAASQAQPPSEAPSEIEQEDKRTTVIEELILRADEEAIQEVQRAVAELVATRHQLVVDSERQVLVLVRSIAERVLARELALDPSVVSGLVREGLTALSGGDHVTVRVGEFFSEVTEQMKQSVGATGVAAEVIVDPQMGPYGCRIETEWGSVDESVESRLRTLLESMSIPPPKA